MTSPREPDRLTSSLRRLEGRPASPGFTERVLEALDTRLARRRRRRIALVAVAVPAAVALVTGLLVFQRPQPAADASRAEELRRQHQALEAELASLREARDRSSTTLYLGTGDDYDLVLDLEPLLAASVDSRAVPALDDLRARPARVVDASRRQP